MALPAKYKASLARYREKGRETAQDATDILVGAGTGGALGWLGAKGMIPAQIPGLNLDTDLAVAIGASIGTLMSKRKATKRILKPVAIASSAIWAKDFAAERAVQG